VTGEGSWILEVRRRLAAQPARLPLVAEAARRAVLVPLLVDAGALWTLLVQPAAGAGAGGGAGDDGGPAFPDSPLAPGEEAWTAALRGGAEQAAIEPKVVVRLGELEELEAAPPDRGLVVPCVGALPTAVETRPGEGVAEVFRVPLAAFVHPTLVEETTVAAPGGPLTVRGYHLGSRIIRGLAARVLEDLLARLR
jgi:hypothetical protein